MANVNSQLEADIAELVDLLPHVDDGPAGQRAIALAIEIAGTAVTALVRIADALERR